MVTGRRTPSLAALAAQVLRGLLYGEAVLSVTVCYCLLLCVVTQVLRGLLYGDALNRWRQHWPRSQLLVLNRATHSALVYGHAVHLPLGALHSDL